LPGFNRPMSIHYKIVSINVSVCPAIPLKKPETPGQ
jgi:hypothetical protein